MNQHRMQQDYSTRAQRKSPLKSRARAKRLPTKLKQALIWMGLGLGAGLLVNYISNPKPLDLASKQVLSQQQANNQLEEPNVSEEDTTVIQLELPAAS